MNQALMLSVFKNSNSFEQQYDFTLGKLMGSKGKAISFNLNDTIIEVKSKKVENEKVNLKFKVGNKGLFGINSNNSNNCFYILSNCNDGVNWRRVYKSEEKGPDSSYDPIEIESSALCLGDFDKKIKIEFYDCQSYSVIDSGTLTVNEFIDNGALILASGNKVSACVEQVKTMEFVDYLHKGMQVSFVCSVDFTASNDGCKNPSSLHYFNNEKTSDYEKSIRQCGSVVSYYDYDSRFPILGFGATIPSLGMNKTEHCFPLNLDFVNSPEVGSIEEMIQVYRNNITKLSFSGPTNFAPSLNFCINLCKSTLLNNRNYYILMILTDGQISDMDETINSIIEASKLPISIIIIGIGNADFSNMDTLDGDDLPLSNYKGMVERDIVQFVEFNKYKNNPEKLSEEVLKEIPKQVEDYYRSHPF